MPTATKPFSMTATKVTSDPPSQIQESLLSSIQATSATPRPTLFHLNADTTWLLQLPYPQRVSRPHRRNRYNILIDPWLRGRQSDVAAWFSCQWHTIDSSVQTIAELNRLLRVNEALAQEDFERRAEDEGVTEANHIDAVVVSHEFTDHCHKKTLLEVDPSTPVFATSGAAQLIKSWKHFNQVLETPPFSCHASDWRATSLSPLPDWLGISRVVTENDALYYHSAISIIFDLGHGNTKSSNHHASAEAVIYTPHGIHAKDLRCMAVASPPVAPLALLHGLHDIKLSRKQLNLGAHNGLQAQRICNAKYWVSTHDEVKKARGLIAPIMLRRIFTLKEALDEERQRNGGQVADGSALAYLEEVKFADLKSGESLLLS